jgi:hypothetical protein
MPLWFTSGSQIERSLECVPSTCLPSARHSTPEASQGIAIHAFIQVASDVGRDKAVALFRESPRWREHADACESIDVDSLPTELAHEVAFAYNIPTGRARELGRNIGRNYAEHGLTEDDIPITIDVVGVAPDRVFVGDYKSGYGDVTPAKTNRQLGLGALCASRVYDRTAATVEIIKPGKNGSKPYHDRASLDIFEIDGLAAELRALVGKRKRALTVIAEGKTPEVREGPWCRYCPSYSYCPAKTSLAVRMGTGDEIKAMQNELTVETAGRVYARAKHAQQFLDKIFGAIYGMAKNSPIEYAPGRMLGEQLKRGNEKLDGDVVYEVVKLLHSQEVADAAVKRTATKTALTDALRGKVAKLAPAMREVLEKVREHGGSRREESMRVVEYPKPTEKL